MVTKIHENLRRLLYCYPKQHKTLSMPQTPRSLIHTCITPINILSAVASALVVAEVVVTRDEEENPEVAEVAAQKQILYDQHRFITITSPQSWTTFDRAAQFQNVYIRKCSGLGHGLHKTKHRCKL